MRQLQLVFSTEPRHVGWVLVLMMEPDRKLVQSEFWKWLNDSTVSNLYDQDHHRVHWRERLLEGEEEMLDKLERARRTLTFNRQLNTPDPDRPQVCDLRVTLRKHGRKLPKHVLYPFGGCFVVFDYEGLPLVDKLAMGDTRAGEILRRCEEERIPLPH